MINALTLYSKYLGISVRGQMQYRAAFLLMSVGHFITTGVEALGVWALFDRFGDLTPWTLGQVAVFYGMVNVSFALTDALTRGFDTFGSTNVVTGDFDRLLVRPRTTALQVAGLEFPLFRVGRLLQGLLVLGFGVVVADVDLTIWSVCLLLFAMLATALFFAALLIIQATVTFWTTESLEIMNTLTYGGTETAQYPLAIYRDSFVKFFTYVIPLGCVTYFPIVGVLGVEDPLGSGRLFQVLSPLAGFAFFALALSIWTIGVRRYKSTGS